MTFLWGELITWKSPQYYNNRAPDDRWKPLLQFPEWPFIKVELEPPVHSGWGGVNKFEYAIVFYHIYLKSNKITINLNLLFYSDIKIKDFIPENWLGNFPWISAALYNITLKWHITMLHFSPTLKHYAATLNCNVTLKYYDVMLYCAMLCCNVILKSNILIVYCILQVHCCKLEHITTY